MIRDKVKHTMRLKSVAASFPPQLGELGAINMPMETELCVGGAVKQVRKIFGVTSLVTCTVQSFFNIKTDLRLLEAQPSQKTYAIYLQLI
eukprot:761252-Hanusia_phi.AAC.4